MWKGRLKVLWRSYRRLPPAVAWGSKGRKRKRQDAKGLEAPGSHAGARSRETAGADVCCRQLPLALILEDELKG